MLRYTPIVTSGPEVGRRKDNSQKDNNVTNLVTMNMKRSDCDSSRALLLLEKFNREGLTGEVTLLRQNANRKDRRQRHSAPDIFYGRNTEIEELRRRHEQQSQHSPLRRHSGERRASLPVLELEQITEEEEQPSEDMELSDTDNDTGSLSSNNSRLPPIYENQRLTPSDNTAQITLLDSSNIQLEFIRKPKPRRKLSV